MDQSFAKQSEEWSDHESIVDIDSTTHKEHDGSTNGRDEVEEIRKQSQKETARVRTWRILVTLALFLTAIAVTGTTYKLLVDQEDKNFRNVVRFLTQYAL